MEQVLRNAGESIEGMRDGHDLDLLNDDLVGCSANLRCDSPDQDPRRSGVTVASVSADSQAEATNSMR